MLTAELVNKVFFDCLFRDGEPTEPRVIGEGVLHDFGFHPERLSSHESEIVSMLEELPEQFHEGKGDGWSFLNSVQDKDGNLWGQQEDAQQLMALGGAIQRVKILFPRKMWPGLPGGVPYFIVLNQKLKGTLRLGEL